MADAIVVRGLDGLNQAFQQAPEIVGPELQRTTEASLLSLLPELKDYPAERPGQTYQRTLTLGRTWSEATPEFQAMGSGFAFEGRIGNSTPYGPFVQDPFFQAWMHQGRWQTTDDVVQHKTPEIQERYDQAGERIVQQIERMTATE